MAATHMTYELVANRLGVDMLKGTRNEEQLEGYIRGYSAAVTAIAEAFLIDNPRFNQDRFKAAIQTWVDKESKK